jgi:hypothetical protein
MLRMGKRSFKVKCAFIQPSSLSNMLTASRVDEDKDEAEAAAEQTMGGGREQTRTTSIATIQDLRRTTMASQLWARRRSRSSGKPCDETYLTASDSLALKCSLVQIPGACRCAELTFL